MSPAIFKFTHNSKLRKTLTAVLMLLLSFAALAQEDKPGEVPIESSEESSAEPPWELPDMGLISKIIENDA